MTGRFTIGSVAVIFDEAGRVLLTRRSDREQWCPPGGGCEGDEPPWAAVVRETKEETGLDVVVESLAGVSYKCERSDLVFVFRCRMVSGQPARSPEVREVAHFPLDALPAELPGPYVQDILDASRAPAVASLRIVPAAVGHESKDPGRR